MAELGEAAAEPWPDKRSKLPSAQESVLTMLRAGILECTDIKDSDGQPKELRIAVPSLGAHLRSLTKEPNGSASIGFRESRKAWAEEAAVAEAPPLAPAADTPKHGLKPPDSPDGSGGSDD